MCTFELMNKMRKIFFWLLFLLLGAQSTWAQQNNNRLSAAGIEPCPLYIPKAFSPNGDGINDQFVLAVNEDCAVVKYQLQIFDRWGRLIYESESIAAQDAWDGSHENNQVPAGAYLYKLSASLRPHQDREAPVRQINRQGSIILIR